MAAAAARQPAGSLTQPAPALVAHQPDQPHSQRPPLVAVSPQPGDLAPKVVNLLHAPALAPTAVAPSVARLFLGR